MESVSEQSAGSKDCTWPFLISAVSFFMTSNSIHLFIHRMLQSIIYGLYSADHIVRL